MITFTQLLGPTNIVIIIGIAVFAYCFKYSQSIFDWIENQTFGTRNFILEEFQRLFIEVKPQYVTYALLSLSFGSAFIVMLLFGLYSQWILGVIFAIIFAVIGWRLPKPLVKILIKRRIKAYQAQMIDGLTLLANGIRAGLSVPQALGMVVSEMPKPISQEFNVILQQNRVGVPLEECFENLAKRVPIEDNDMFVSSVNILRETGGNLAETFDTIISVIRERIRLQQKIDTYIAQGMIQAYTIGAMPFVIGGLFLASDSSGLQKIISSPLAMMMVAAAIVLDIIGMAIIMKIIKIDV